MSDWEQIESANEEGRRNVEGMTERDEIADALELLAGVDEGENTDYDRLLELANQVRGNGPWEGDVAPVWLREMLGPKNGEERRQRRIDLIAEVIRLREERENLTETVRILSEAGQQHIRATEGLRQAIGSLIDVLDELCMGLAVGQSPDRPWAETVSQTLSAHRQRLGFTDPA